jgi:hypothetical protein
VIPYYCCTCGIACLMELITSLCILALTFENSLCEVSYTLLSLTVDVVVLCVRMWYVLSLGGFLCGTNLMSGVAISLISALL